MKNTMKGHPSCPTCHGKGFIYAESLFDGGRYCTCVQNRMRLRNMERIWKSLSKAQVSGEFIQKSTLWNYTDKDVWFTAPVSLFKQHLKACCFRQGVDWGARVVSDADILDCWFSTAKAKCVEIYDLEIANSSTKAADIADLVSDPPLVIIILGVKKLPNKETPNGILEAISYRKIENKPVWVVDQPDFPILSVHHNGYSPEVEEELSSWKHVDLTEEGFKKPKKRKTKEFEEDAVPISDSEEVEEEEEVEDDPPEEEEVQDDPFQGRFAQKGAKKKYPSKKSGWRR